MADEPISPQKLIDDAAKALDQNPVPSTPDLPKEAPLVVPPPAPVLETSVVEDVKPVSEPVIQELPKKEEPPVVPISSPLANPTVGEMDPLPPPPTPEPMIIPTTEKEAQNNKPSSDQPTKEKKKTGKGILIATLLFFILTLPIAIYYITQSPQFAEIRSRAALTGKCNFLTEEADVNCKATHCASATTATACGKYLCCYWEAAASPTPTKKPTATPTRGPTSTPGTAVGCWDCATGCCDTPTTYGGDGCRQCTTPTKKPTATPTKKILPTPTGGGISGCTSIKNYSPSQPSQSCTIGNLSGAPSTFYGYCVFFHCPNGCTGGCGENTPGVWWEFGACNSGKLASNECGQQDTIAGDLSQGAPGKYCIPEAGCDALIQCSPSCVGVPKVTNTPGATNTPVATNTPLATNTPTTGATPTDVPTTPEPGQCDASCDSDSNCESGLSCVTADGVRRCRDSYCPNESDCSCPGSTATPTTRYLAGNTPTPTRARLIAEEPITTPTEQPTPKIPVAGVGPGILGAITVIGSVLLLVIGLIL